MAGIIAYSATVPMDGSETQPTGLVRGGYSRDEEILLSTTPAMAEYEWSVARPDGSSSARAYFSSTTDAAPTFRPDVNGSFVVSVTDGVNPPYSITLPGPPVAPPGPRGPPQAPPAPPAPGGPREPPGTRARRAPLDPPERLAQRAQRDLPGLAPQGQQVRPAPRGPRVRRDQRARRASTDRRASRARRALRALPAESPGLRDPRGPPVTSSSRRGCCTPSRSRCRQVRSSVAA